MYQIRNGGVVIQVLRVSLVNGAIMKKVTNNKKQKITTLISFERLLMKI